MADKEMDTKADDNNNNVGVEEQESTEWKAEKYRNKVIERIDEEKKKTDSKVPKAGVELEEFVFKKAKSKREYLDLVARLLCYVRDFNKRNGEEKKDEEKSETAS